MLQKLQAVFLVFLFGIACAQNAPAPKIINQDVPEKNPDRMQAVLDASSVTVTAIKDGNIPVQGSLNLAESEIQKMATGEWRVRTVIDLKSFNTGLALRDQRVRDLFFQVANPNFSQIVFEMEGITDTVFGEVRSSAMPELPVRGRLSFAGLQKDFAFLARFKIDGAGFVVRPAEPIMISIADWHLDAAKKALMQACLHREIQDAVSVTFAVKFQ